MIGVLRTNESAADLAPQPDLTQLSVLIDRIRATGLAVELHIEGLAFPLGGAVELSIYRVIQEALTNTLKHAHASRASVTIRYSDSMVDVRVVDNGDVALQEPILGHGIGGMRERVAVHGGTLQVGPLAEGGWALDASFRVNARAVPV
jgi:signal transduction histidine kinase